MRICLSAGPSSSLTLVDTEGHAIPAHVVRTRSVSPREGYPLPQSFLRMVSTGGDGVRPLDFAAKQEQLIADIANFDLTPGKKERVWKVVELEYLADVPATGYRTYALRKAESKPPEQPLIVKGNVVENQFMQVKFHADGTFDLYHKPSRREYKRINVLEDSADVGDEYDYAPPVRDQSVWSRNRKGRIRIVHQSSLSAVVEVNTVFPLPTHFSPERRRRSVKSVRCAVQWRFTMTATSPWVEVELLFQNLAEDHRLRLHVPTPIRTRTTLAGQPFYVAQRPVGKPGGKNWKQPPAPTNPMQQFCSVEDRKAGIAILAHGLYEYEATRGSAGVTLAVTLLRAVGWLSRPDLTTRPGNAGPQYSTPEAQCPGPQRFRYAIMPYVGTAENLNLMNWAQAYRVPVFEEQCLYSGGSYSRKFTLLRCEPSALVVTAIKKCEHRDTAVVRIFNASHQRVKGKVTWGMPVSHAWRVNFEEERLEEIPVYSKTRIELDFPAWRIITLELQAGRKITGA